MILTLFTLFWSACAWADQRNAGGQPEAQRKLLCLRSAAFAGLLSVADRSDTLRLNCIAVPSQSCERACVFCASATGLFRTRIMMRSPFAFRARCFHSSLPCVVLFVIIAGAMVSGAVPVEAGARTASSRAACMSFHEKACYKKEGWSPVCGERRVLLVRERIASHRVGGRPSSPRCGCGIATATPPAGGGGSSFPRERCVADPDLPKMTCSLQLPRCLTLAQIGKRAGFTPMRTPAKPRAPSSVAHPRRG